MTCSQDLTTKKEITSLKTLCSHMYVEIAVELLQKNSYYYFVNVILCEQVKGDKPQSMFSDGPVTGTE